uniref:Uncharacterized protein n=1 Tax=viral metagenome TaxID=1070528 RepID=A0A6M3INI2_9ZZZZ
MSKEAAILMLISDLLIYGPGFVRDVLAAWSNADPTAEDFDALANVANSLRPVDPLKK